ncbi:MAG: Hsp33 family molecular chaperone HslO [Oscillospiraceae bacterium]|nr:Hsp33 family molecular chaperone HslO [Oscillospiraceae bacterium]
MANILRGMTADGSARVVAIDGRSIVNRAIEIHHTMPTATAALGRVLMGASLMGSLLGEPDDLLTLRFQGNGGGGTILASSDYMGNVRGLIGDPSCDYPLRKTDGKLDVARCVGQGQLSVLRSTGSGEPFRGVAEIQSGEIAEDIAYYFAASEQVPTLCALGVLVDTDGSCKAAGGILIQLLPFADPEIAEKLEANAKKQKPVTSVLEAGRLEDLLEGYLEGIPFDLFDGFACDYRCDCSRYRTDRALISLGSKQLRELIDDPQEDTTLSCEFCGSAYSYTKDDLRALLAEAERKKP